MGYGRRIDHFTGSSLPSHWTAVTAGDGVVTVSDSIAHCTFSGSASNNDAAAILRRFDPTLGKYHILAVCVRTVGAVGRRPELSLAYSTTQPVPEGLGAWQGRLLFRHRTLESSPGVFNGQMTYWDTAGAQQRWDDGTKAWSSSSTPSTPQVTHPDDYHIFGIEWDAQNSRVRGFHIHRATGSTFADEAHGPKLFALTDWVNLSAIRNGSNTADLWMVAGMFNNDANWSGSDEASIEWALHEWSDEYEHAWTDQLASGLSNGYTLKHWRSPTGAFWLPESRTGTPFALGGAGAFDERDILQGSCAYDPIVGTYYQSYQGKPVSGKNKIGLASSTSGNDGTWTKHGVIIDVEANTHRGSHGQNVLFQDFTEPDPARRWKCLVSTISDTDSLLRVYLYYASSPTGTWTLDGLVLDQDALDGDLGVQCYCQPLYASGMWYIYYVGMSSGATEWKTYRAHSNRMAAGTFTKDRSVNYFPRSAGVEMTITSGSSTSRIVDVNSTTGVDVDALVVYDEDANGTNWRLGRVRRIASGTQLELYHLMPGLGTPGVLRTLNRGKSYPTYVRPRGDEWEWFGTMFQVLQGHASFTAALESSARWKQTNPPLGVAPTPDWFASPGPHLGRDNNSASSENPRLPQRPIHPYQPVVQKVRRRRDVRIRR